MRAEHTGESSRKTTGSPADPLRSHVLIVDGRQDAAGSRYAMKRLAKIKGGVVVPLGSDPGTEL